MLQQSHPRGTKTHSDLAGALPDIRWVVFTVIFLGMDFFCFFEKMKGLGEKNEPLSRVMAISVPDALFCVTFWVLLGFLVKLVKLQIKLHFEN